MDDTIRQRIQKLVAIARDKNAPPGEKQAAIDAVKRLMAKYNLTFEDIKKREQVVLSLTYVSGFELRLICQIVAKVTGSTSVKMVKSKRRNFQILVTKAQSVEITALYKHYRPLLARHFAIAYRAFLEKNDLLSESTGRDWSDEEIRVADEASRIAAALPDGTQYKRVGAGTLRLEAGKK